MSSTTSPAVADPLIHAALCYSSAEDYTGALLPFLRDGLDAGEPTLVFVPSPNLDLLRADLHDATSQVTFLDAADVARNPARVIPAARRFAETHRGRRIRVVGEPIWPGRSAAEIREGVRHEACVNMLFADIAATVICPYDAARLDAAVLADALRTHPYLYKDGEHLASTDYVEPTVMLSSSGALPVAPDHTETLTFHHGDLPALRRFVTERASRGGLSGSRLLDLVTAVNELASNTLVHSDTPGCLRIWRDAHELICEISDHGSITDPAAGRRMPLTGPDAGRGLWVVNHLCDLVEMRSGSWGSMIRLHIRVTGPRTDALDQARLDAGLTYSELWLRFIELGGTSSALQLEAFCYGALKPRAHDYDVIAHALNERFAELGSNRLVAYSDNEQHTEAALPRFH